MKREDIIEMLTTETLKETKLFFEVGVKTPYQECHDDLAKITKQSPNNEDLADCSDQDVKL